MSKQESKSLHATINEERQRGEDQGLTGMLIRKILAQFEMLKLENPSGFEQFLRDYIVNMDEQAIKVFFTLKQEGKSEACSKILREFKEHQHALEQLLREETIVSSLEVKKKKKKKKQQH